MEFVLPAAALLLFAGLGIIGAFGLIAAWMPEMLDKEWSWKQRIASAVGGTIALLITVAAMMTALSSTNEGPCLRQGHGIAYDSTTKTNRAYTYCIERGTWDK